MNLPGMYKLASCPRRVSILRACRRSGFSRIDLPKKIVILVSVTATRRTYRHNSSGAWRTPLGDAPIDEALATALKNECPILREVPVAHSSEHSIEVQLPFLQVLSPGFAFVPISLGTVRFDDLVAVGEGLAHVLAPNPDVLLLATSDLNHYEDDATTRLKDHKAIDQILALNPAASTMSAETPPSPCAASDPP